MADINEMFFQECDDLLEGLSSSLIDLEAGTGDSETINSMFRAVHSIKGGAGAFHLDQLVAFAHAFENVMDEVRNGSLACDESVIALMFSASDHLSDLVDAARNGEDLPAGEGASVLSDLKMLTNGEGDEGSDEDAPPPSFEPTTLSLDMDLGALDDLLVPPAVTPITVHFRPHKQLYENGHDPALLIRGLNEIGDVSIDVDLTGIRPLSEGDWDAPSLSWKMTITPEEAGAELAIKEVFEFVEGLCDLKIESEDIAELPALDLPPPNVPEVAVVEPVADAAQPPAAKAPSAASKSSTIRVDLDRVDRLINLVGELVIAEAMLRQSMDEGEQSANADEALGQLKQLSGAIQESVMAIRAQPVRSLFQRMSRIVRETSREAGKSARLVTIGDSTEVDKTVTERLVDPLTHMMRNAVDHGLETPDDRIEAGKERQGTVTLEAAHRSGRVLITLSDDGAGINRPRVRQIAEEKGLIRPEDDLTDSDIDNLLFKPGFSTATEVSNLSGRGVGMDVVRNEIQSLGGRVSISSTPGLGTAVTISLPLTLAVLEGMVVRVADQTLIVPTLPLREMLQPGQAVIHTLGGGDQVLSLNGELVPINDLGSVLGYRCDLPNIENQSLLLIEGDSGRRSALAVDEIAEQREVVIKGLEQNYQSIPGIAAATILGDGKIALIVDTDQVVSTPSRGTHGTKPEAVMQLEVQSA